MDKANDYGLGPMAIISSMIFIIFAFSFSRPKDIHGWRSFRVFSTFVVALFTEMYGFPLTIYTLSGWLGSRYPKLNVFAHKNGLLWETIFGEQYETHVAQVHAFVPNWNFTAIRPKNISGHSRPGVQ